MSESVNDVCDLFIIGGGINGCGIARDAAGRGLKVMLCEQGDLAQATSSASTKLFHGGLRYLEYYEFRLVREALLEREVLLRAMPHISWPMRFVLPHQKGMRPAWFLRLGLFIYDHLGGRKILPATKTLDLTVDPAGKPLKPGFCKGFEYSDCWVDDARLVALNARAAADLGAKIMVRTRCLSADREGDCWAVSLQDLETGASSTVRARGLVNAGGPWVDDIIRGKLRSNMPAKIRLVRGSHVVTKKLFDHDKAYIFQNADNRIIFAIPYLDDFTLIGTTDRDHEGAPEDADCTEEEASYLIAAASEYFATPIAAADIRWTYSGVRPLYDDGASTAAAATRDYVLHVEDDEGRAPLLNVFGGKITTYRRLAESALAKLGRYFPKLGAAWTGGVALPGGDFPVDGAPDLAEGLLRDYRFLDEVWANRLIKAYGTEAREILGNAETADDLGTCFGWNLTEAEVRWLMAREWAREASDILWRRSKVGLRLSKGESQALADWMDNERNPAKPAQAVIRN